MQHSAEGRVRAARRAFAKGVDAEPSHTALYHAWGVMEFELGNVTAARELFQRGVWSKASTAEESVALWSTWALLEERAGDVGRAREYLRSALKADRFSVSARTVWAAVEGRAGERAAARSLYEDAITLDPQNAEVWAAYEAFERAAGLLENADDVQARAAAAREAWEGRQTLAAGAELPATGLLPGPLLAAGAAAQAAVRRQQQARARASLGDTLRAEYGEVIRKGAEQRARRGDGGGGGGGSGGSGGGGGSGGSGGGAIYAEPERGDYGYGVERQM